MPETTIYTFLGPMDNATCFLVKELLRLDESVLVLVDRQEEESAARLESFLARYERVYRRPLPRPLLVPYAYDSFLRGVSPELAVWLKSHATNIIYNSLGPRPAGWSDPIDFWEAFAARAQLGADVNVHFLIEKPRIKGFERFCSRCGTSGQGGQKGITLYATAGVAGDSVFGDALESHWFSELQKDGGFPKNLVPGDWFAAVVARMVREPRLHGRLWNLPAWSVSSGALAHAWHALDESVPVPESLECGRPDELAGAAEANWECEKYPLPELTHEIFTLLLRDALSVPAPVKRASESFSVETQFEQSAAIDFAPWSTFSGECGAEIVGLRLTGPGGGDWTLALSGKGVKIGEEVKINGRGCGRMQSGCRVARGLPVGEQYPLLTLSHRTWSRFRREDATRALFEHAVWENGTGTQRAAFEQMLFPVFTMREWP
ncbi:MAG: hypothetical protein Q4G68_12285 [Planctomycetia bacterium]|nr:hypothetical protein [Planctomycetia bacterium]